MKAHVIASFIDRQTGKRIKAGSEVPPSILKDKERLSKLQKTGCVAVIDKPKRKAKAKTPPAAQGSAAPGSLFQDNGEGTGGDAGSPLTDPEAMGGGDGGDSGTGAQPDETGQSTGDGESQDDSSR